MILNKKIRISRNGETSRHFKPHVTIRPGDHVTFMRGEELIHVEVVKPGERRGPAKEAQTLYKVLPTDMSSGNSAS